MAKKFTDRYKSRKWRLMRWGQRILLIGAALFFIFQFVLGISVVNGNSMLNTLQDGDLVLYNRMYKELKKGDIVSVSLPSGEYYVKRVVAMAGDSVDIRDGKLYINGEMEEADYVLGETLSESVSLAYPYTVEEGHVFVIGDNRPESVDSRYFGTVNVQHITGVLQCRFGLFYLNGL